MNAKMQLLMQLSFLQMTPNLLQQTCHSNNQSVNQWVSRPTQNSCVELFLRTTKISRVVCLQTAFATVCYCTLPN